MKSKLSVIFLIGMVILLSFAVHGGVQSLLTSSKESNPVTFKTGSWNDWTNDGLALWLDASAITGLGDGDVVTFWEDQSESGNDAISVEGFDNPVYVNEGHSGKPALQFNGSSVLRLDNFVLREDFSQFFVVAGNQGFFIGGSQEWDQRVGFISTGYMFIWEIPPSFSLLEYRRTMNNQVSLICSGRNKDDGVTLVFNGGDVIQGGNLHNPVAIKYIGYDSRPLLNPFWQGEIAEIIIFDRLLSDSERKEVESYLMEKYSIGD